MSRVPPSDELVYRPRALEHRARVPGEEPEPLELPAAWARWTWPAVLLTLAAAGLFALVLFGAG
ncbi:MAG TPA: hypothetical protein VLT87_25175 [Thermoanaerobaculia bacterium]|nr:hypothetical protein [Thermoanaerobaculia bacterium]